MDTIFDFFFKLFARIVWGSEEEWYRRRKLRELLKALRNRHPDWTDPSGKKIGPPFASLLYKLARIMKGLEQEYSGLESISSDRLITAWLDDQALEKIEALNYENFSRDINNTREIMESVEELERNYQDISELLASDAFSGFKQGYTHLLLLKELIRFDYKGLIGQFDPSFSLTNPRYVSSFSHLAGQQIQDELLDFYYIWAQFSLSSALERNLAFLKEEEPDGNDEEPNGTGILEHLREINEDKLRSEDLLLLLRLIKDDPEMDPGSCPEEEDPIELFKQKLQKQFETSRTRIEREVIAKKITSILLLLFGKKEIQEAEGYTSGLNQLLYDNGFPGFIHLMPVSVISSWINRFHKEYILESFNSLIREGFFPNPDSEKKFSYYLEAFSELSSEMERLEMILNRTAIGERSLGTTELNGLLQAPFLSQEDRHCIEQYLTASNKQAAKVVELAGKLFGALSVFLTTLREDAKQKEPRIVSNIRSVYNSSHQKVYDLLPEMGEKVALMVDILKQYTVVGEISGK